jgi:hypothetical protein
MLEYPSGFADSKHRKRACCGILAIAMACNVSFEKATQACKAGMLPHQKRMGVRTYYQQRMNALWRLGIKTKSEYGRDMGSVGYWIVNHAKPDTNYIISFKGHTMSYRNNAIGDQKGVYNYLLRPEICRKKIIEITEILV